MTSGLPSFGHPQLQGLNGFGSADLDLPAVRPPSSHLSAARLYLNLPRRSGPGDKVDPQQSRLDEGQAGSLRPSPMIASPTLSRNRSATVSDPAEIRATSPHLRSTFDRDRLQSISKPAGLPSSNPNPGSSSSTSRPIIDLETTGLSGWSSPQPLPSPVPTDHQGVDPLGRSPPKSSRSPPATPHQHQQQHQQPSLRGRTSQTTSPTSTSPTKDGGASSKTSAFFATSFGSDLPAPPRPLAHPSTTVSSSGTSTTLSSSGPVPSTTVQIPSTPPRISSFPVHSTSRSTHHFLPSEIPHLEASSSNLNRARSLNSAARPGTAGNGHGNGHGHGHGNGTQQARLDQTPSSRSSAFFSTSFAATPPRSASPTPVSPSPSSSGTGTRAGNMKGMTASGFALGLGRGVPGSGGKESPRSVTMPVPQISTPSNKRLQETEEDNGSFISGLSLVRDRTDHQHHLQAGSPTEGRDPAAVISPPRKLTREVSGTFGPRPVVKEEPSSRTVKAGDVLVAPEGEAVLRLAQPGSPVETTSSSALASSSSMTRDKRGPRYWKVDRVMGEGAFSLVWSAREMTRLPRSRSRSKNLLPPSAFNFRSGQNEREDQIENGEEDEEVDYVPAEKVDEVVAIKMMDKRMCRENDRTRISFVREVAVLRHLSHAHIVSYLSSFSTTHYHCLVLENLSGGELFDLLQTPGNHRRMGEDLVRRIFGELGRGVHWLHEAKVVHRDLKLENIMFTVNPFALVDKSDPTAKIPIDKLPTPLVKLTDFGLARFIDPASPMLETRCGSESFTAPEIIMGNPYDGRDTDSWAVGVILFALVTGELPFDRVTSATLHDEEAQRRKRIMAIAKGDYKWPIGVGSEGVKMVVARLLTRDASKRTRVGPALWEEIWMHGPGSVPCPASRSPGAVDETLPDGRIKLLDGFLFNKDIELEASKDAF